MPGGVCVPRGHAWHARPPQWPDTMRYGRSMSEQYASYWNAFLLNLVTKFFAEKYSNLGCARFAEFFYNFHLNTKQLRV